MNFGQSDPGGLLRRAASPAAAIRTAVKNYVIVAIALALGCSDTPADPSGGAAGAAGIGGTLGGSRIFVTEMQRSGDLGGISGADALCASEAAAAGLEGEFRAWLSTSSSPVGDRLVQSTEPYVLVDGTRVADDWQDLTDGNIQAAINLDASEVIRSGDTWTGTLSDGEPYAGGDCEGFTSAAVGMSQCGSTQRTDGGWTAAKEPSCAAVLRLFCIEQ